jgi:hypothetical protein
MFRLLYSSKKSFVRPSAGLNGEVVLLSVF